MIYEFLCKKCNAIDEIVRHHMDLDDPVICDECKSTMVRQYTPPVVKTQGESIPYYNVALGQMVKNDKEAAQIARARGLVEVGNEDVTKHIPAPRRQAYDL
jgi:putative FmdB family regulatory protein